MGKVTFRVDGAIITIEGSASFRVEPAEPGKTFDFEHGPIRCTVGGGEASATIEGEVYPPMYITSSNRQEIIERGFALHGVPETRGDSAGGSASLAGGAAGGGGASGGFSLAGSRGPRPQDGPMDPALYECLGDGTGRGGRPKIRRAGNGLIEAVLADGTVVHLDVLIWDDVSRNYYRPITSPSGLVFPAAP